jgi:uncharacterized protein (TIGR03435 family)
MHGLPHRGVFSQQMPMQTRSGQVFQINRRSYVLAAVVGLSSASLVHGQDKRTRLTFDVMSIKPWKPGQPGGGITTLPGGQEYRARGTAVIGMISVIYRISIPQISGGPDWIKTERWNIDAKADHGGYNLDQLHEMYKNMLADQFKLKFHWETREGPVYLLTIDKSGLKMKVNDSPEPLKGGVPIAGDPMSPGGVIGRSVAMEYLTWWLGQRLQQDERPVINKTGLDGYYDFKLAYMPELAPDFPRDRVPPDALDRPNIFQAVREQLGLRLEPQKGPVEHFVVDHVERSAGN